MKTTRFFWTVLIFGTGLLSWNPLGGSQKKLGRVRALGNRVAEWSARRPYTAASGVLLCGVGLSCAGYYVLKEVQVASRIFSNTRSFVDREDRYIVSGWILPDITFKLSEEQQNQECDLCCEEVANRRDAGVMACCKTPENENIICDYCFRQYFVQVDGVNKNGCPWCRAELYAAFRKRHLIACVLHSVGMKLFSLELPSRLSMSLVRFVDRQIQHLHTRGYV